MGRTSAKRLEPGAQPVDRLPHVDELRMLVPDAPLLEYFEQRAEPVVPRNHLEEPGFGNTGQFGEVRDLVGALAAPASCASPQIADGAPTGRPGDDTLHAWHALEIVVRGQV